MSDSLLVEKIAGTNGKEVIVTYVARDSANNVGKASRMFSTVGNNQGGDVMPAAGEGLEEGNATEEGGMTESKIETEMRRRQKRTGRMPEMTQGRMNREKSRRPGLIRCW